MGIDEGPEVKYMKESLKFILVILLISSCRSGDHHQSIDLNGDLRNRMTLIASDFVLAYQLKESTSSTSREAFLRVIEGCDYILKIDSSISDCWLMSGQSSAELGLRNDAVGYFSKGFSLPAPRDGSESQGLISSSILTYVSILTQNKNINDGIGILKKYAENSHYNASVSAGAIYLIAQSSRRDALEFLVKVKEKRGFSFIVEYRFCDALYASGQISDSKICFYELLANPELTPDQKKSLDKIIAKTALNG